MSRTPLTDSRTDIRRIVGRHVGRHPGPTLVAVAGIHGNEPAGIEAAQRVLAELPHEDAFRGEITVLAGNTRALREGTRYVHKDLNRLWWEERIRAMGRAGVELGDTAEDREQKELLDSLWPLVGVADPGVPRIFLDLHTFSSPGPPFLIGSDTPGNRAFAHELHLPLIVGLQQAIGGALTEFMLPYFDISLAVEGGTHDSELARLHHEAILWSSMTSAGMVDASATPRWNELREALIWAADDKPPVSEVIYRHTIQPEDGFRMRAGFSTFQPIQAHEELADDRNGPVLAPYDGVLLMPLYQALGNDGFFIGREIAGSPPAAQIA